MTYHRQYVGRISPRMADAGSHTPGHAGSIPAPATTRRRPPMKVTASVVDASRPCDRCRYYIPALGKCASPTPIRPNSAAAAACPCRPNPGQSNRPAAGRVSFPDSTGPGGRGTAAETSARQPPETARLKLPHTD